MFCKSTIDTTFALKVYFTQLSIPSSVITRGHNHICLYVLMGTDLWLTGAWYLVQRQSISQLRLQFIPISIVLNAIMPANSNPPEVIMLCFVKLHY